MRQLRPEQIEAERRLVRAYVSTIRQHLAQEGMSQRELANRMGVDEPRIAQILNPHKNPTLRTVAQVAEALGLEARVELRQRLEQEEVAA
jgi:transcriptional regulator with XRE-family HTH domain